MNKNSLEVFTEGARLLAEADTIQKARELKSLALTAADWARRKGMGEQAVQYARAYALDAERKMGAMLKAEAEAGRLATRKRHPGSVPAGDTAPATTAEVGLTRKERNEAEKLAALPKPLYEEVRKGKKSRTQARRQVQEQAREQRRAENAAQGRPPGDAEIMESYDCKIQPYDVWSFQSSDKRFGNPSWPGRIPAQLVMHALYFFSDAGDTVLDPMAGGGTVPDVCRAMGRTCHAYDLVGDRPGIEHHDLAEGWPDTAAGADLIFWDPPYFDKMDAGYVDESISRLPRDEYLAFFAARFQELREVAKPRARLAFLMSDWNDETGKVEGIFLWDYAFLLIQAGWKLQRHIQVPLSTQQVHPDIVLKFREARRLARLERYLLVAIA